MQVLINASADSAVFAWSGGRGEIDVVATFGGGSVQLQRLGPDGTTWLNVGAPITANGLATFHLAPGSLRVAVVTATAVYANVDYMKG